MDFDNLASSNLEEDKALWNIICGLIGLPAVFVAHKLGLFSLLNKGSKTTDEICNALGTEKRATHAMLDVNVSLGLITNNSNQYLLTNTAKNYLLNSSPTYLGCFLDLVIANNSSISIDSLHNALKTGKAQAYEGQDIFESHAEMEERARVFTRAMHSASVGPAMHWPKHLDLSDSTCFLDIGGGSGAHAISALNAWSNLKGIVFDLAPVCEVAKDIALESGVSDRFNAESGDLWETPFPSADVHFYSQIYHDWPEDKCQFLTQKSFDSLEPGGKIIIHEMLYNDDKSGPFVTAASSIGMLLWTQGRQYSGKELTEMLTTAGFIEVEVKPTYGYWSIVTGRKP